jgi:hypothetical protein
MRLVNGLSYVAFLAALLLSAHAFSVTSTRRSVSRTPTSVFSFAEDTSPSDTDLDPVPEFSFPAAETIWTTAATKEDNLMFIQSLGAITGRGEFASKEQKQSILDVISALELENPTAEPASSDLILGRWELVYCSTQLFRSSPFFMAG